MLDTFSNILSVLSDTEKMIVNCTIMRLKENEALDYLRMNGHDMSRMTYYRMKRRVEEKKMQRLYEIARIGFVNQHIERIDQLELIQREMWKLYHEEQEPRYKAAILEKIASVQPYLSAYYEATKMVIKEGGNVIQHIPNGKIDKADSNCNCSFDGYPKSSSGGGDDANIY
jgi:hypothetical protein